MRLLTWRYRRFPWLEGRLASRDEIEIPVLQEQYFHDLPSERVAACLEFLRDDVVIPVQLLRPTDELLLLLVPPKTRNPFRWLAWRARYEDAVGTIMAEVGDRLASDGSPTTLGDIVRAWAVQPRS